MPTSPFGTGSGTVVAFDDFAGWGTVREADGTEWFFHCTRIADGTRRIAPDTAVTFVVEPAALGRWEAVDLR